MFPIINLWKWINNDAFKNTKSLYTTTTTFQYNQKPIGEHILLLSSMVLNAKHFYQPFLLSVELDYLGWLGEVRSRNVQGQSLIQEFRDGMEKHFATDTVYGCCSDIQLCRWDTECWGCRMIERKLLWSESDIWICIAVFYLIYNLDGKSKVMAILQLLQDL